MNKFNIEIKRRFNIMIFINEIVKEEFNKEIIIMNVIVIKIDK